MPRRGRPRKSGPRELNGRPQRQGRDRGTKETQSLRQWWAGPGDPVLTSYPLGILFANQAITDHEHSVACHYAWLHSAVFGRHSLAAVSWELMDRGRPFEVVTQEEQEREERHQGQLTEIHELLRAAPRRCRTGLDNIAVYERPPRWMRPVDPRPGDVSEARFFKIGLGLLCGWSLGENN